MSQVESEFSGLAKRVVSPPLGRLRCFHLLESRWAFLAVCAVVSFAQPGFTTESSPIRTNPPSGGSLGASGSAPAVLPPAPVVDSPVTSPALSNAKAGVDGFSSSELLAVLTDHHKSGNSAASRVIGVGPSVTVMAQPAANAKDRDLKIDAVFFAKTLMDSAPHQIEKVDVLFSETRPEDSKVISIDKKAITAYGEGSMSAETFLTSLHLRLVNAEEPPAVEPGPLRERRLLIWERIERLRKNGTGVKPFQAIFQSIETAIKGGDISQLSTKLGDLEEKLAEQEEQVAIAKRTAMGHGLTSRSSPSSPQVKSSSDQLKQHYAEVCNLPLQVFHNNPKTVARLQELKGKIEPLLNSGRSAEARTMMEEFCGLVEQERPNIDKLIRMKENVGMPFEVLKQGRKNDGFNGRFGGRHPNAW